MDPPAPNGDQPQMMPMEEAIQQILALHNSSPANPGCTFSLYYGNQAGRRGYAVARFQVGARIEGRELDQDSLRAFIAAHLALLTDPANCIGTWFDETTGWTWFDISTIILDETAALDLARQNGEDAIYDLASGQTIWLSDRGLSRPDQGASDRTDDAQESDSEDERHSSGDYAWRAAYASLFEAPA